MCAQPCGVFKVRAEGSQTWSVRWATRSAGQLGGVSLGCSALRGFPTPAYTKQPLTLRSVPHPVCRISDSGFLARWVWSCSTWVRSFAPRDPAGSAGGCPGVSRPRTLFAPLLLVLASPWTPELPGGTVPRFRQKRTESPIVSPLALLWASYGLIHSTPGSHSACSF